MSVIVLLISCAVPNDLIEMFDPSKCAIDKTVKIGMVSEALYLSLINMVMTQAQITTRMNILPV